MPHYTLMHISDLHAGAPFRPDIAEQVRIQAHELQPDLVVVSGDLVQRADFPWQWEAIKRYLATLPGPQLIVPGNHDVPLFNGFSRLFLPMRPFNRHISADLNPVFQQPGLLVVGANTAHGLTLAGGRLSAGQRAALETVLSSVDARTCKVVVFHHQILKPPQSKHSARVSNVRPTIELLDRYRVDLLLCGHLHYPYVETTTGVFTGVTHRTIVCQSGTTTSRRGRATTRRGNAFHVINITDEQIRITPHVYEPDEQRFVGIGEHTFSRQHHAPHP